jgi:hypothetical protein
MAEDWSAFPAVDAPDEWAAFPKAEAPAAPTWGETAVDDAKGIGKGLASGTAGVVGSLGDFRDLFKVAGDKIGDALGLTQLPPDVSANVRGDGLSKLLPTTQNISDATGVSSLPNATTPSGKALQGGAAFIPGAFTPGGEGSLLAKAIKFGILPGAAYEGAGATADAAGASPGTKAGMQLAASLAAPLVGGRVATLLPLDDVTHTANIAALRSEGVNATAGQATDRETMRYFESILSPGRNKQQGNQFTQAAFKRVGMDVPDGMVPGKGGTVDQMLTDAGARYDGIAARNTMRFDTQGAQDLNNVQNQFLGTPGLYSSDTENAIRGTLRDVGGLLQQGGGTIAGPDYITLRSRLRAAARGADPQKAEGLNDIVNALDSSFERGLPANSPDKGALPAANQNYRNALVLERAATAAGTQPAKGAITPANLASAAKAIYGKRSYIRGQDPFSDLSQPAVASLSPLPDSGTSQRNKINAAIALGGGALGYGYGRETGDSAGDPVSPQLLGEAGAGLLAPLLLRRAVMNPVTQAYLRNQAMVGTPGLLSLPGAMTAANGARGLLSP